MNLPSDTPRLPKWIFLVGDAFLIAAAWLVFDQSSHPVSGLVLTVIATFVVAAVVIGVIPFVADYARTQDEALDNRQRSLQALSVTVAAAAEQIAIAATGLQGLAEAAQDNLGKSEAVSKQINERISELQALLAGARKEGGESAAKLEAAAKAIAATAAGVEGAASRAAHAAQENHGKSEALSRQILEKISELRAHEAESRKDGGESAARLEALVKRVAASVAELESAATRAAEAAAMVPVLPSLAQEVPPVPPERIVEIRPAAAASSSPFEEPAPPEAAPAAAPSPETAPEAPAPRKRAPRKPSPPREEAPKEPATDAPAGAPAPEETATALSAPEIAEPAVSADGATRITVTAYIGIGNRLFIRGDGPGLTWEKGAPLTFVSIGKWRWETNDATGTVRFRLYKNDETECTALGERSVEPGAQQDLTAAF